LFFNFNNAMDCHGAFAADGDPADRTLFKKITPDTSCSRSTAMSFIP